MKDPDFIVSFVFFFYCCVEHFRFEIISSSFLAVVIPLTYIHFFYFILILAIENLRIPDVGEFKGKAIKLIRFVSGLSIVLIHFKHPSSSIAPDSSQGGGFNQN